MPRNAEDARIRLMRAAIELFAAKGFDQTTAAEIAARAGVTERTFFRHFPDKREVLFDRQEQFAAALRTALESADADLSLLAVLRLGLARMTPMLEANRPLSEPRYRIIVATPALQEREVAKHVGLVRVVEEKLLQRGIAATQARLAAEIGLAILSQALVAWFANPESRLDAHIDSGFTALRGLLGTV